MFYIIRANKKGKWLKTSLGCCNPGVAFRGVPIKCVADAALIEARERNPKGTYRLIYSEEEL